MAASHNESKIYPISIESFLPVLRSTHFTSDQSFIFRSENPTNEGVWYRFHHGVSMSSWGEKITITLTRLPNNATNVHIHSECGLPTQVIDWGKNKKIVQGIFNYLDNNVRQVNPPQNPQPQMQATTASQKRCSCGAVLSPNAAFCTSCGKKASVEQKRFCTSCGAPAEPDAAFCAKCGNKLK